MRKDTSPILGAKPSIFGYREKEDRYGRVRKKRVLPPIYLRNSDLYCVACRNGDCELCVRGNKGLKEEHPEELMQACACYHGVTSLKAMQMRGWINAEKDTS